MSLTQTRSPPVASKKPNRLRPVAVSARNRAATSNGSTILDGVDGRSAEARRFRDLVLAFAEPLGGFGDIAEHDAALCRHAASLTMQSEQMQRQAVRGEPVDAEQLVRVTNALTRTLNALSVRHKPKKAPSLREHIARRQATAASEA